MNSYEEHAASALNSAAEWFISVGSHINTFSTIRIADILRGMADDHLAEHKAQLESLTEQPIFPDHPTYVPPKRIKSCVEQWPECWDGDYNPQCCRFPKQCSCSTGIDRARPEDLVD